MTGMSASDGNLVVRRNRRKATELAERGGQADQVVVDILSAGDFRRSSDLPRYS